MRFAHAVLRFFHRQGHHVRQAVVMRLDHHPFRVRLRQLEHRA